MIRTGHTEPISRVGAPGRLERVLLGLSVALGVYGCASDPPEMTHQGTGSAGSCIVGWYGMLDHDATALDVHACWGADCGTFALTVWNSDDPARTRAFELCEEKVYGGYVEEGELEGEGVGKGDNRPPGAEMMECLSDLLPDRGEPCSRIGSEEDDYMLEACAVEYDASPIFLSLRHYGNDRLQDGDVWTLRVEGPGGEVLVDQTLTIDEYERIPVGEYSCKRALFDLEGEPRGGVPFF